MKRTLICFFIFSMTNLFSQSDLGVFVGTGSFWVNNSPMKNPQFRFNGSSSEEPNFVGISYRQRNNKHFNYSMELDYFSQEVWLSYYQNRLEDTIYFNKNIDYQFVNFRFLPMASVGNRLRLFTSLGPVISTIVSSKQSGSMAIVNGNEYKIINKNDFFNGHAVKSPNISLGFSYSLGLIYRSKSDFNLSAHFQFSTNYGRLTYDSEYRLYAQMAVLKLGFECPLRKFVLIKNGIFKNYIRELKTEIRESKN
jgi:hypothetical protein